jgi:hypothetical protein
VSRDSATVEVLAAEVRVLMVGSRQVTMSVYNQLDEVIPYLIEPFGRVAPKDAGYGWIYVVGRHRADGTLVSSRIPVDVQTITDEGWVLVRYPGAASLTSTQIYTLWRRGGDPERQFLAQAASGWADLPLIVLAGLR